MEHGSNETARSLPMRHVRARINPGRGWFGCMGPSGTMKCSGLQDVISTYLSVILQRVQCAFLL